MAQRRRTISPADKKSGNSAHSSRMNDVYKIRYVYKEGVQQRPASDELTTRPKQVRRLYTPVEAERLKAQAYGTPTVKSPRKARRTPSVKRAPLPPTAPKNRISRKASGFLAEIKEHLLHLDYMTLALVALLAIIGILAVHSATLTKNNNRFDIMQIGMAVVGFGIIAALSFLDYDGLTKNYRILLIFNVCMLAFTAIFGHGADTGGDTNRNWVSIGSIGIQPAEIGKILYIITFASHLDNVRHRLNHIKTVLGLMLHAGLIIGLVLLEKDLGQATVYIAITIVMLFTAGLSLWYFIGGAAVGIASAPLIWTHLADYQKSRILVGFQPELDPLDRGYQAMQSKTAIAAGGVTGLGYRQGLLSQSSLLPAKWTDMIFAVIGEEAGLIGALIVLFLLFLLVVRLFHNASEADKLSGSLICAGVGGMILYQTIENVGMCLGMLPVIGITLPFLSYGGSSVLGLYLAIGMVISVYAKNDRIYFRKR